MKRNSKKKTSRIIVRSKKRERANVKVPLPFDVLIKWISFLLSHFGSNEWRGLVCA